MPSHPSHCASSLPLHSDASPDGFRRIFLGWPNIGGRYSVLSDFGLVPAAIMGVDVAKFLDRTTIGRIGVPLLREGVPIGVINLLRRAVRPFTQKQIELLTTFADQAVIAIENVRLFDEVQARTRELSEALEQQTATSEVLQVVSRSPGELEPVFAAMLANAIRICEAKFGNMLLYEAERFRAAAFHGAPSGLIEFWQSGPHRVGPNTGLGLAVRTRQVVHIADVREGGPSSSAIRFASTSSRSRALEHCSLSRCSRTAN
jgi:GAF domain